MWLIPAYAKVNLCLAVRARRPDGFHDIDTVAVAVDWHDLVGVTVRPGAAGVRLRVTGPARGDAPADAANLAWRAATAYAEAAGGDAAVEIWLDKRLPAAAGLGGGSADAAAVLRALRRLWPAPPLSVAQLGAVAATLGSDVPLLLAGGGQRVEGRGERLRALPTVPLRLAVVVAGVSSTAAAYGAVLDFEDEDDARIDRVAAALLGGTAPDDADLGSGLEAPACRVDPSLDERVTALRAAMPDRCWHMTGSGGAMFALAHDDADAEDLVGCAADIGLPGRACRTVGTGAE